MLFGRKNTGETWQSVLNLLQIKQAALYFKPHYALRLAVGPAALDIFA